MARAARTMGARAAHRLAEAMEQRACALERFDRRMARRLHVGPEFYDLPYEPVELVADDGVRLAAWFVPAAAEPARSELMALLHHHYGGQKAALLPWLELFHRLGIGSLAFDARGHAGSPCERSQGTYRRRLADVRAARAELRRRGARQLLGYGQSQGAAVVLGGLGLCSDLAGVIVDSGPAASALVSLWGLARDISPERGMAGRLAASRTVVELVRRTQPGTYPWYLWRGLWALRHRPLLWLHGSEDRVLPRAWARPWFAALRPVAPRWHALCVVGAPHAECLQHGGESVERAVAALVAELARPR